MVIIEADVTIGRILCKHADQAGVLYTVSSGDEPGCSMVLYKFIKIMGYEVIMIGKGKNTPLISNSHARRCRPIIQAGR